MAEKVSTHAHRTASAIVGESEMARLIRAYGWRNTSLGEIAGWPQSLVTCVNLLLQTKVPLVMFWGADGIMLYNDAYSAFAGKRHPELLGSKVVKGWPEVADFNRHIMQEVRGKGNTLEYRDYQLTLHRNGIPEDVWMNLSYSPIIDESGKPNGVFAAVIETTDQVMSRRRLEEIATVNKSITDNVTTGLMIMDTHHFCTFMNPAAEQITGYSFDEVKKANKSLHEIIHYKHPDGSKYAEKDCPTSRAIVTKHTVHQDDFFTARDGSMYPVAIMSSPIVRDGEIVGIVEEIRDISAEKAAAEEIRQLNRELEDRVEERTRELTAANKELNRSNEELQDFAYVASHDLQEPLRKIAAFANLLESDYKDDLPEEAHRYLRGLQKSSERMRTLISDLLTYSRVTTQARPFEKVNLHTMAEEALEDMQSRIEETKATITVGKLCTVDADPLQIRLLLQNLISNAMKYAKTGVPPKITVSSKTGGGWCELSITDNGIGFDEQYADRIFTIFQRLHGRGEYEGTGVGLAICKKIVDRHGGTVTAKSKLGHGSTFTIRLPGGHGAKYD